MRIHLAGTRMSLGEADILEYYLRDLPFVEDVKVFERTGDAIVKYNREADHREGRFGGPRGFFFPGGKPKEAPAEPQSGREESEKACAFFFSPAISAAVPRFAGAPATSF